MTRNLEEFFNLPDKKEFDSPGVLPKIDIELEEMTKVMEGIDKIDQALPMVKHLETADREMDHLAELAEQKFQELMDLGMNVEPRFSGAILQTAGTLLGHAITAKQAKIDKKLRMIELQLKKARLDQTANKNQEDEPQSATGMVLDRNELIKTILANNKK
jgi:hypothetical protein